MAGSWRSQRTAPGVPRRWPSCLHARDRGAVPHGCNVVTTPQPARQPRCRRQRPRPRGFPPPRRCLSWSTRCPGLTPARPAGLQPGFWALAGPAPIAIATHYTRAAGHAGYEFPVAAARLGGGHLDAASAARFCCSRYTSADDSLGGTVAAAQHRDMAVQAGTLHAVLQGCVAQQQQPRAAAPTTHGCCDPAAAARAMPWCRQLASRPAAPPPPPCQAR